MTLVINLFGGLELILDGKPLTALASKKTEALVVFLAVCRQKHSRDFLADMLWDNRSQARAAGNLRVVLSSVRKTLGDIFEIDRYEVCVVNKAPLKVDAVEFETRINCAEVAAFNGDILEQASQLDSATRLYEGDFLQNYYLRDSSGFESWVVSERMRLHQLAVTAFSDLTALCAAMDDADRGLEVAGRFLRTDPLNEQAHRSMMRFLAVTDQRTAALRQFERCRKLLLDELGVEPDEETRSLYDRIFAGEMDWKPQKTLVVSSGAANISRSNLPRPLTSFIGRKAQLEQIESMLRNGTIRMLTLTGPGGVGKTRLALESAARLKPYFPDGVFFVNLAPLNDCSMVSGRIARVLNVTESAKDAAVLEMLKAYLKEKRLLLLLDNFEQVIGAAPEIGALVSETDFLKVITTSREPLQIYGEQTLPLQPLSAPPSHTDLSLADLGRFDAVELFVQRAKTANPSFVLTDKNSASVVEICVRLDGIPLALELAAARTPIFTPEYLLGLMGQSLDVLENSLVDMPPRHRKLRATLDWSYELLSDEEKELFTALAVFEGGADISSINQVIPPDERNNRVNLLESLVNKSLLVRAEGFGGQPRFVMLKTIDQFASDHLREDGRDSELRQNHARYFADLAAEASQKLLGSDQGDWAERIRLEYDNLIAALDWAFSGRAPDIGMQLFGALWGFWYYDGQVSDGLKWLSVLQPWIGEVAESNLPAVFNTAGMIYFVLGDRAEGERWNTLALELSEKLGDRGNLGWAMFWLSAQWTDDPDRYKKAFQYSEKSICEFEAVGDRGGLAWAYNQLGEISRLCKDYDSARRAYEQSVQISRANRNARREAVALINLSTVAQYQGDSEEAYLTARDGLAVLKRLGLIYHTAMTLALLAGPLIDLNETEKAVRLMGASAAIFRKISADLQPADAQEIDLYSRKARERLGSTRFAALFKEGEEYTYEQAMRYALG